MAAQLFELFSEMLQNLPAKAVLRAARLQRQMLEDDLVHKRTMPLDEARSIVAFCNFIENATDAVRAPKVHVPIQHLGLYRNTVKRLVEGGELPYETGALFDGAFSATLKAA